MNSSFEDRVRMLEDSLAISNLKTRYLDAADGGWDRASHNAALIAPMFVADGWWHSQSHDRADGRDAIFRMFSAFTTELPFAYHRISNPLIEIDGDRASGHWHVTWIGSDAHSRELWAAGVYTDEFERTTDGWRMRSVFCKMAFFGPYADGWATSMGTVKTLGKAAAAAQNAME